MKRVSRYRQPSSQIHLTLEFRHVPRFTGVVLGVILMIIRRYAPPVARVRAVEALRVSILQWLNSPVSLCRTVEKCIAYQAIDVDGAGSIDEVPALTRVVISARCEINNKSRNKVRGNVLTGG